MKHDEIEKTVLEKIKPSPEEYEKGYRIYRIVEKELEKSLKKHNIPGRISLQGSFAKDTWISGELDLDVFVLFPEHYDEQWLKTTGFKVILEAFKGYNYIVKYAAHPYITIRIEDVDVDVVPAFDVSSPTNIKSAVDRTPYHTKYVKSKLTDRQRDEVRLLKKFMKGIDVYGAEIKVEGFSGYLVELLIIHYGSFRETITNASTWRPPIIIDIEKYYNPRELIKKFKGKEIIVIDPVDPNRNVAAAVSKKSLATFIAASRRYLEKPDLIYFFPRYREVDILEELSLRRTSVIAILFDIQALSIAPDILWGELKRTMKNIVKFIEDNDFKVLDYDAWSDEKTLAIIVVEVEKETIPLYTIHNGPPVYNREHSDKFLNKYISNEKSYGPWIGDDGRWRVLRPRKYNNVRSLLVDNIETIVKAPDISKTPKKVTDISGLLELTVKYNEIKYWLSRFIYKKPPWLI